MRHRTLRAFSLLPALLAPFFVAACRDSGENAPAGRPAPRSPRAAALDVARSAADGETETGSAPQAGEGIEAVRAAVRGLVMLQETIGEAAALRATLAGKPDAAAPEPAAVTAALEGFRALARMEATGAAVLGLETAPWLERAARDAERWAAAWAEALRAADDGTALQTKLAELPDRLDALDDELRAARTERRTALAEDVAALPAAARQPAACLAAAADALYAWDLAARELETRFRPDARGAAEPGVPDGGADPGESSASGAAAATRAAALWREFLDSGDAPGGPTPPVDFREATEAARAADETARAACRNVSINALPPPGEDLPVAPEAGDRRRRGR